MKKEHYQMPHRLVLYPKDIENITGRSARTARKMLQKVRLAFAKTPDEFVTVKEFCAIYGIEEDLVTEFLKH